MKEIGGCPVTGRKDTDGVKFFVDHGWVLVRASGTEPLDPVLCGGGEPMAAVDALLGGSLTGVALTPEMLHMQTTMMYYTIMPDGTVKQLNPFTGTEVWAVAGRREQADGQRPMPETAKPLEHCTRRKTTAASARRGTLKCRPEKSRLIRRDGHWERIDLLAPDRYFDTMAEFRRTGNMFEIVTLDYWRKNYAYKMPASRQKWREDYLANPAGLKHITDIVQYKLRREGKTDEQIEKMPMADKLALADAFFGGGHEMIIARRHYREARQTEADLYSSGEMTEEEHYWYFKLTIDAIRDITLEQPVRPLHQRLPELAPRGRRIVRPSAQAARVAR